MNIIESLNNLGTVQILGIKILLLILLATLGVKMILCVLENALKKGGHVDDAIHTFILSAVRITCYIVLIAILLQDLGVHMSTIVAVLGAAGAAIALALRDSLANIAGGVMIIVTHPFSKGDLIRVGENRGRVENIDLFLTTLKTLDNQTVTIPNGLINTSVIFNESNQDIRRVDCKFSVGYGTDLEKAKKILACVCDDNSNILKDPAPIIGVAEHGDSGIMIDVLVYCQNDNYWNVKYALMEDVKNAFEQNDIEIPYPHMDVNLFKNA